MIAFTLVVVALELAIIAVAASEISHTLAAILTEMRDIEPQFEDWR